jgi:hypothetical protein
LAFQTISFGSFFWSIRTHSLIFLIRSSSRPDIQFLMYNQSWWPHLGSVAHSKCVFLQLLKLTPGCSMHCMSSFGHLATVHSCSLVTIALNAICVFVFGEVVTTTDAVLYLHHANPSTVAPLRSNSPLRVCPDKDYRCVSLLSSRGRLTTTLLEY